MDILFDVIVMILKKINCSYSLKIKFKKFRQRMKSTIGSSSLTFHRQTYASYELRKDWKDTWLYLVSFP